MEKLHLLLLAAIPILFAITLHEVAHGWVARQFGDDTAYRLGRITLNPLAHVDWFGTVLLPVVLFFSTGVIFGWAKPVPVHFGNLRNPRKDSVYVALAGPMANLLMALFWASLHLLMSVIQSGEITQALSLMSEYGVAINISLMVFNLIPILPLDGGRIAEGLLPYKLAYEYGKLESFGLYIVIILASTGALESIVKPIVGFCSALLIG
jgi:Zn-dependent protease